MHCLRSELAHHEPLDLPPTAENLLFLGIGMVLLFSLVLALCIFERLTIATSFGIASGACGCALVLYGLTRAKAKVAGKG